MSRVLEIPAADPAQSVAYLQAKLAYYTDSWDLLEDLRVASPRIAAIIVVDTRSPTNYARGHVPGAINIPHRTISAASVAELERSAVYVTYCDGVGCNASTKGALALARLGFHVKELQGGMDWWRRDGYAVITGDHPGEVPPH